LVQVLADNMGDVFPEIRSRVDFVTNVIKGEEESFNDTLDTGIAYLTKILNLKRRIINAPQSHHLQKLENGLTTIESWSMPEVDRANLMWLADDFDAVNKFYQWLPQECREVGLNDEARIAESVREAQVALVEFIQQHAQKSGSRLRFLELLKKFIGSVRSIMPEVKVISGDIAFKLYDTYGFPLDLTELMAREQGLTVDNAGFEVNMEQQRARARAAQKKEVIEVSQISADVATSFIGYDVMETPARVVEVISVKGRTAVLLDRSPCYAEMGGQVGDTGLLRLGGTLWRVVDTQKAGHAWLHFVEGEDAPEKGAEVTLSVDLPRRAAIQRHHTVTHLFHWALHEVANREASQKGSFVGPDKLTFDFNSGALTPGQLHDIEKLVNERILENAPVSWTEMPYASVKSRKDVMQFFGDKYGETVRVVQIGGAAGGLDGYSMELCGGTHTRATGEIGLFRVVSEGAIAAGVRRVEAVAGLAAWQRNADDLRILKNVSGTLNIAPAELEKRVEAVLAHQKELEKQLKALKLGQAGDQARALESRGTVVNGIPLIVAHLGDADGDTVAAVAEALKAKVKGVVVLGAAAGGSVVLLAQVSPEFTAKVQAGKIIQAIAPIVGGKGGGKPDFARGGGKDAAKLDEALAKVPGLLGG
jgi:alanyl-tRNA synthetase